jgi:uncharacterized protein YunC (DUF1805 family)
MIEKKLESGGTTVYDLTVNGVCVPGFATNIPGTELQILQVRCRRGMMFCGLFSTEVLAKLNFPAAVFSAPRFEDMMERRPIYLTDAARALGATMEMTGAEMLLLLDR